MNSRLKSTLAISTSVPVRSGPPSPTFSATSATTQMSGLNIKDGPETIITRAHLRTSVQAFEELLKTSTDYRNALSTLSAASAQFAIAVETCSRLRGVKDDTAVGFQAAGGLHHIIGNHEQVLSETIRTHFDKPLRQHLQAYKAQIAERSAAYEQSLIEKNKIIRKTESENMNVGRRKRRDLDSFRAALTVLQNQVTELDRLKADYYRQVLAHEEETWEMVMAKVSLVVRTSLDVYDRISAKSSDPSLEPLLQSIPDPFDTYGPQKAEDEIFSILPPLGILNNRSGSSSPIPDDSHNTLGGTGVVGGVKSWMDQTRSATQDMYPSVPSTDWSSSNWADADARMRRLSLPSALPSTSTTTANPVTFNPPSTSSSSASSSSSFVPFPASGSSPPAAVRRESKLRHVLSVIDEARHGSDFTGSSSSASSTRSRSRTPEPPLREEDEEDTPKVPRRQESIEREIWAQAAEANTNGNGISNGGGGESESEDEDEDDDARTIPSRSPPPPGNET